MKMCAITPGYVYLALFDDGLTKIGCTTNPEQRMTILKCSVPTQLLMFCPCPTDNALLAEHRFHEAFKTKRVRREWFRLNAADWQFFTEETGNAEYATKTGIIEDVAQLLDCVSRGIEIRLVQ